MSLSLLQNQTMSELENLLYGFAPGSHFEAVSSSVGLGEYWQRGSKGPAINNLLKNTYEYKNEIFCTLILKLVEDAISYQNRQGSPLQRGSIEYLNQLLLKLQFKIPDLWDPAFLGTLYVAKPVKEPESINITEFYDEFMKMLKMEPHERGYAFEKYLYKCFLAYDLKPRGSFKIVGEQIDGSFDFDNEVYLLEAKWHNDKTSEDDLLVFRGKIESKSIWTRGLFVSYSGLTEDGLIAFSKGKSTNMIGMSGEDLSIILLKNMRLDDILKRKIRNAAETGEFYFPVLRM